MRVPDSDSELPNRLLACAVLWAMPPSSPPTPGSPSPRGPGDSQLSGVHVHPSSQAHLQLLGFPRLPFGQEQSLAHRCRRSELLCCGCRRETGGMQDRLSGFMVSQKGTLVPPFLGVREGETRKCSLLCNDAFSHERFLTFRVILRQVRLSSAQTGKPVFYLRRFQVRWTLRYRS